MNERDPNEVNPEWLFRMFEKGNPEHLEFRADDSIVQYRGRHSGFSRFDPPVVHERRFTITRLSGALSIEDVVLADGVLDLVWRFRLAPDIIATQVSPEIVALAGPDSRAHCALRYSSDLACSINAGWYSPSYGIRSPAGVIEFRCRADVKSEQRFLFRFDPT